jgi:hypothetical protein
VLFHLPAHLLLKRLFREPERTRSSARSGKRM